MQNIEINFGVRPCIVTQNGEEKKAYGNPFNVGDLTITCDEGKDERINWKEGRYVCTRRMREKIFDTPQCIGMCSIES